MEVCEGTLMKGKIVSCKIPHGSCFKWSHQETELGRQSTEAGQCSDALLPELT